jgi:hypothetical protein
MSPPCERAMSRALVLVAGVVEPQERLEHFLAHVLRNARPVVVHNYLEIAMIAMPGDRDGVGVPRGVRYQIGETALERGRLHRDHG